jgi:hypothetical protein
MTTSCIINESARAVLKGIGGRLRLQVSTPSPAISNSVQRAVMTPNINKPVPGAKEFYPLNEPSIGTTLSPVGPTPSDACLRAAETRNK